MAVNSDSPSENNNVLFLPNGQPHLSPSAGMLEQKRMVEEIKSQAAAQSEPAGPPEQLPKELNDDLIWPALVNMFIVEALSLEQIAKTDPNPIRMHGAMDNARALRKTATFLVMRRPDLFPQKAPVKAS